MRATSSGPTSTPASACPGLGLKRGLSEDVVVAPYATALGAMIDPEAAVRNFARLRTAGALGPYGFREALDYTARRLPEDETVAIVGSYMAHHQGMALVAIGNVLHDDAMVKRFHAEPIVQATELLLQERMPRDVLVARPRAEEVKSAADVRDLVPPVLRRFTSPHDLTPRTHLLSNGRYAVMVTAAGSGYSRWGDIAVTRWREDVTRDSWGSYLFLRDTRTGAVWSAGHQPSGVEADSYEVRYSEDQAEFARRDGSISTAMTVVVSAEHDAEIRRVSLTNLGSHGREIELTSYAEIVLAPQAADVAHPAFQNLFVQTEFAPEVGALVATRRPRSGDERQIWAAHVAAVEEQTGEVIQYETDRARFLGRGRSVRSPVSVIDGRPLSNTVGAVLDPIFSLRCRVSARPGRHRPRDLLDRRRGVARGGPGPGRQVPRGGHLRTGGHARLDAGPGPAPPPGHRGRRGPPLPAPRQPDPVLGPVASAVARPCLPGTSAAHPGCGPTGSPATCRSCSSGSTRPRTSTSSASCSGPTSTGG